MAGYYFDSLAKILHNLEQPGAKLGLKKLTISLEQFSSNALAIKETLALLSEGNQTIKKNYLGKI